MSAILGPYYAPHHRKAAYFNWIRQLLPAWARIHQPAAGDIADVQGASPKTLIMLRWWDIDDHNGDRHREVAADPVGAARQHAKRWEEKLQSLTVEAARDGRNVDPSKWYIGLLNEPNKDILPQVVQYTREFLRIAERNHWRLGVGVSSVGNFPKPGEHPHSWDLFKPLESQINDTGSVLMVHEYWLPEGPDFVWIDEHGRERHEAGNTAWRHHSIPLDVRILIGESGANGFLWNRHTSKDDGGWQNYRRLGLDPAGYARQVKQYIEGCDSRVEGALLYMLDHHTAQWKTFDIEPALPELLEIRDAKPQVKHTVHIPDVTVDQPKLLYVTATAGLNVRKEPTTDAEILNRLPHGTGVEVSVKRGDWWSVSGGWVHGDWLSETKPEPVPTPEPVPSRECWARAYPWVLKWEGGWADHPSDPGGATMKGITIGTYARWREAQGQPKPTKNDLRNISDAEVEAIYREWYWKASGADKLPWPLCLAVFDTAVNGGVGRATDILARSNGDFLRYMGILIDWYTRLDTFPTFGRAWIRRRAEILLEAAK